MALERLDPAKHTDKWLLDHYARYLFATQICAERRVLDIACGYGYGSKLIAQSGAREVVGIDVAQEAIDYALAYYAHNNIRYSCKDIYQVNAQEQGLFDVIVCFETLEHVAQAEHALDVLRSLVADEGIFIISVPNDIDLGVENPFHLRKFTEEEFYHLLQKRFTYVQAHYQNHIAGSAVWQVHSSAVVEERAHLQHRDYIVVNHENTAEDIQHADCFVAICSNAPLPLIKPLVVQSGEIWRTHNRELSDHIEQQWSDSQGVVRAWEEQKTYIAQLEHHRNEIWSESQRLAQAWEEQRSFIVRLEQERDAIWSESQRLAQAWEEQRSFIVRLEQERDRLVQEVEQLSSSSRRPK